MQVSSQSASGKYTHSIFILSFLYFNISDPRLNGVGCI
jgi:hypothetical protein